MAFGSKLIYLESYIFIKEIFLYIEVERDIKMFPISENIRGNRCIYAIFLRNRIIKQYHFVYS